MRNLILFCTLALALPLTAQLPVATAEHLKLGRRAGTWDAALEYPTPDGTIAKATGVSVRQRPLGAFWLIDNFQADIMGQKFLGHGSMGYDPAKKKYVGTWIDSFSPNLLTLEGSFDKTGKILTMKGRGRIGFDGKPVIERHVTTHKNQGQEVFEIFAPGPDGKEIRTMKITYTRRGRKMDKVRDR